MDYVRNNFLYGGSNNSVRKCTICDKALSKSPIGIKAHLNMHIRKGEMEESRFSAEMEKIHGGKVGSSKYWK